MSNYCYVIQEREFINLNQNIFKIGKTTQEGLTRFKQYSKGSKLILFIEVYNCHEFENDIKKLFNKKFKQMKCYGTEYYEGNKNDMIKEFINIYKNQNIQNNLIQTEDIKNNYVKDTSKILNFNNTYYYPQNEIHIFNEILKISIKKFTT